MKYDSQLTEVRNLLSSAQNLLVALPANCGVDCLAAGLSVYLSLKNSGKSVAIVSESTVRVSHTNLFGVGSIQNQLTGNGTGTWVLRIGGAVGNDNKPVFVKVDYDMKGSDLELKFPIVPGQKFEPTHITPGFEGGGFELILVVGAANLESLGGIYSQNPGVFNQAHLINIDNSAANNQFGTTKVVDPQASSLSEMVGQVLAGLGLILDSDTATNLLTGIYEATNGLQFSNSADTFEVVAQSLRAGGKRPVRQTTDYSPPSSVGTPDIPASSVQSPTSSNFDLSSMYAPSTSSGQVPSDNFVTPQVVDSTGAQAQNTHEREPGVETSYSGSEAEEIVQPEEDWLTPKVYSGKSIG